MTTDCKAKNPEEIAEQVTYEASFDQTNEKIKRWVKCFACGTFFEEINWYTPPSCPGCHRSRVD